MSCVNEFSERIHLTECHSINDNLFVVCRPTQNKRQTKTNSNKLNAVQKQIMAEYMRDHPDLAKNAFPNCALGRATCSRLWEVLTKSLNSNGPPIKDAKLWKKVFADLKHQAKKKLSFNKAARATTGGGPFEEKVLTQSEQLLIEASGLMEAVEGLGSVKTVGNYPTRSATPLPEPEYEFHDRFQPLFNKVDFSDSENNYEVTGKVRSKMKIKTQVDPKLSLLQENWKAREFFFKRIEIKIDRLLEINERLLEIKKEQHKRFIKLNEIELQMKTLQLEILRNTS